MSSLLLILLSSVLVAYFAIGGVRALQPFVSDDAYDSAVGIAVVTAMNLAVLSPVSWLIDHFILQPLKLDYLAPVLFVALLLIASLISEFALRRGARWLPVRPGFLLLVTSQSALLGVSLLGRARSENFFQACVLGLWAGASFGLLLLAFSSLQLRLEAANIPGPFRQAPVGLVTIGIMALAVMGFTGLISE